MWQRYNQSTNMFEKSTNNGASWTPMNLVVPSALTIEGVSPILATYDPGAAAGKKRWRLVQYQGADDIRFEKMLDDNSNVVMPSLIISGSGSIYAKTNIYERDRTVAMGHWIDIPAAQMTITCSPSGTLTWQSAVNAAAYCKIGNTVSLVLVLTGATLVGTPVRFYVTLPSDAASGARGHTVAVPYYSSNGGTGTGMCTITQGGTLDVLRDVVGTAWVPGSLYFYISITYSTG